MFFVPINNKLKKDALPLSRQVPAHVARSKPLTLGWWGKCPTLVLIPTGLFSQHQLILRCPTYHESTLKDALLLSHQVPAQAARFKPLTLGWCAKCPTLVLLPAGLFSQHQLIPRCPTYHESTLNKHLSRFVCYFYPVTEGAGVEPTNLGSLGACSTSCARSGCGAATFSITTLSIMALSITVNKTRHSA